MSISTEASTVKAEIESSCPWLRHDIEVKKLSNKKVARFRVYFLKSTKSFPTFEVISDEIGGDKLEVEEVRQRGPNAFIDALPFEMLRTAHDNPQIMVTVGNLPAVCTAIDCDYTYL